MILAYLKPPLPSDLRHTFRIKNLYPMPSYQHFSNPTSLKNKGLGLSSINQTTFIVNSNTNSEVITLLYPYKFGGGKLALLCQYVIRANNLDLLIKDHIPVVIVLVDNNLILKKTISRANAM